MNLSGLEVTILLPAFIAGLLVTATHVPLGQRVLKRGIIFLDLAVAQIAGLGIIFAHSFHWQPGAWQVQLIAMAAAIIGVLILNYTEKRWPDIQEALIGSLFVLASSASILLLARNPHGGEQLKELLIGQILWVSYEQIIPVLILYAFTLIIWFRFSRHASPIHFYIIFAITITASVQLVGIYLVFASLIIPALAIRNMKSHALATGYLIGGIGYFAGLVFSLLVDLPTGAVIVFTLAIAAAMIAGVLNRKTGISV